MRLITAVASASICISMRRQVQCLQAYIVSTAVSVHLGSLCVHLVYRHPTACCLTTRGGVCRTRRERAASTFIQGAAAQVLVPRQHGATRCEQVSMTLEALQHCRCPP
jgi:hypothetical protein